MLIILKSIYGKFLGLFFCESDQAIKLSIRRVILGLRLKNIFLKNLLLKQFFYRVVTTIQAMRTKKQWSLVLW